MATTVAGLIVALPAFAAGADVNAGKALVEANCFHCHDTSMYTRPDRKVKDLPGLGTQIRRCERSLELQWFDEDVANVVAYLNQTYYKFPE